MNEEAKEKYSEHSKDVETSTSATFRVPVVTIERVREVIGGSDLEDWSAQKLLDIIGSGSKRTHQKHLETLRDEYHKTVMLQFSAADAPPPMPKDLADTYWRQAWAMATAKSATHIVQIAAERDALKLQLAAARSDVESYINSGEAADERMHQATQDAAASAQMAAAESERANSAKAALEALQSRSAAECQNLEVEIAHVRQHSEEQLELAEKNAQLMFKGLQEAVDRQAQREVDVRQQLADANRRADNNAKRVIELTDKLGTLVTASKS